MKKWKQMLALVLTVSIVSAMAPINLHAADAVIPKSEQELDSPEIKQKEPEKEAEKNQTDEETEIEQLPLEPKPTGEKEIEADTQDKEDAQDKEDTQEKKDVGLAELIGDDKTTFLTVMTKLYEENKAIAVLQELDESARNKFYNRLSEKELYEFTVLYKYSMIMNLIEDSKADTQCTKEDISNLVEEYLKLLLICDKHEWTQDEEVCQKWDVEAFDVLKDNFNNVLYVYGKEEKTVIDFTTYAEYLQSITDINVFELLEVLNAFDFIESKEQLVESKQALRKYLYSVYGYEDEKEVNIITGFTDYDIQSAEHYLTFTVTAAEKKDIDMKLPATLSVYLLNEEKEQSIPVTWKCKEDVLKTKLDVYTFEVILPKGYAVSKELQAQIESKKAQLPAVAVEIEAAQRLAQARGTFRQVTLKKDEANPNWWVFVKVDSPSEVPTLAYRITGASSTTIVRMNQGSWVQDGVNYNFAYPMGVIDGYCGNYTYNISAEGSYIGAQQMIFGSAQIGSSYYWGLKEAVDAVPNNGTIYLFRDIITEQVRTTKSMSIYPKERSVTVTNVEPDPDSASLLCLPQGSTAGPTWNLGGDGDYTLTFDDNNKSGTSVIGTSAGTINLKKGVRLTNSKTNGVYSYRGTTNIYAGAVVDNNRHAGLCSDGQGGTINVYGGNIYNNGTDGVRAQKAINMSEGNIYSNGQNGVCVGNVGTCHFTMTGGKIYSNNQNGVLNFDGRGSIKVSGGEIYSNNWNGVSSRSNTTISSSAVIRNNYNGVAIYAGSGSILNGSIYNNNNSGVLVDGGSGSITGGSIYGSAQSGVAVYSGTASISNGDIHSNRGNGIYIRAGATASLASGTVYQNFRGILADGNFNMSGGTIRDNSADNGGGIFSNGTLSITGGTISNNRASNYGGGLYIGSGNVSQISAAISGNVAGSHGGGIFTNISTPLRNATINSNGATSNSGGGIYLNYATVTIDNSNISNNSAGVLGGGVATYQGTINYNSGKINSNTAGNHGGGVYVGSAGRFIMNGGEMTANKAVRYYGGAIFNDGQCTTKITGGNVYKNTSTHGGAVFNNSGGLVEVAGGSIYLNSAAYGGAVFNQSGGSTFNIWGGTIYGNTASAAGGGVYNENGAYMGVSGGDISSNDSPLGSCIYQTGVLYMAGNAWLNNNNDVYLPTGKVVTITGALTLTTTSVARLTPSEYSFGTPLVRVNYGANASTLYQKFALTEKAPYLLRPGDYEDVDAKTADTDVVISRAYTIKYDGNSNEQGDVLNLPKDTVKYWYESVNLPANIPTLNLEVFKGWDENKAAANASLQPKDKISANKDMTIYAIWETRIKVTYVGNQADSGTTRSEYVTRKDCDANGDYTIKKNSGYTNFTKKINTFTGWGEGKDKSDPDYPESRVNKISFSKLQLLAGMGGQQAGTRTGKSSGDNVPEAVLYDVWDAAPEMRADGVQEFYEGTEVTKEKLLENVRALDKKDGEITKDIRIVSLEYSSGKLVNGEKQPGLKESWAGNMPDDYKLDTWFLQLDKNDSPVIHKITYAVTDSAGNETKLDWTVKVLYNEFPVIKAEDRYFTLDEAKGGIITEQLLTKDALASGKLSATDKEDDILYPDTIAQKIKIADFKEDEFKSFNKSGYVVLTYSVQDSMGADGKGKETLFQVTVHIVKDGEVVEPEAAKYVRFINKKYYEKNVNPATLSDKEHDHNGGLNVDSKWYHDPKYKAVISKMWDDSKEPEEIWGFTHEDVLKVKEYIEVHGIGNSEDPNALNGFIEEFKHTIQ